MLAPLLLAAAIAASPKPSDSDICAKAEREKEGDVYVHPLERDDGVKGVLACVYVAAGRERLFDTIVDYEAYPNWNGKVEKIDVQWSSPVTADIRFDLDMVWKDTWYAQRRLHHKPEHVEWKMTDGEFKVVEGRYELIPVPGEEKATWLFMEQYMQPDMSVPGFVERYFAEKASRQLLEEIRDETLRRLE